MTEELFWRRAKNLYNIINAIKNDIVYKTMWQDKLKELMKRKDIYEWGEIMTWREETVECLKCDHRYTERNQEFLKVCPNCGNDDVLETVYVATEEEENDKR